MKQVVLLVFVLAVSTALASQLNNVLSAALGNYINNGAYLSVYQKYTTVDDPLYTPVKPGSSVKSLNSINLQNASSWTGALKDVAESGSFKVGVQEPNVDNATYYGTNPERGWVWDFSLSLIAELSDLLSIPVKLEVVVFPLDNSGFFGTAVKQVNTGNVHAVIDATWLPSRVATVDLSGWYDSPATWSVYAARNISVGDSVPQSLNDWTKDQGAGLKVAYPLGSSTEDVNKLYFPQAEGVIVVTNNDAIAAVQEGRADITLSQDSAFYGYLLQVPNTTVVAQPGTKITYGGGAAFILKKD